MCAIAAVTKMTTVLSCCSRTALCVQQQRPQNVAPRPLGPLLAIERLEGWLLTPQVTTQCMYRAAAPPLLVAHVLAMALSLG
jgi:hypothetical protein